MHKISGRARAIEQTLLPQARERAAQPDMAGRVELHGRVAHAEMAAYDSAADFFVLGSHRESCGYPLFGALACGAAPLGTDMAAFRALIAYQEAMNRR